MIDVDHQQAERLAIALRARQLHRQQVVELAAIAQPGEAVLEGQQVQLVVGLAQGCRAALPGADLAE